MLKDPYRTGSSCLWFGSWDQASHGSHRCYSSRSMWHSYLGSLSLKLASYHRYRQAAWMSPWSSRRKSGATGSHDAKYWELAPTPQAPISLVGYNYSSWAWYQRSYSKVVPQRPNLLRILSEHPALSHLCYWSRRLSQRTLVPYSHSRNHLGCRRRGRVHRHWMNKTPTSPYPSVLQSWQRSKGIACWVVTSLDRPVWATAPAQTYSHCNLHRNRCLTGIQGWWTPFPKSKILCCHLHRTLTSAERRNSQGRSRHHH